MDKILEKYEVRKSNKEKTQFIDYLSNRLYDKGYEKGDITIEERWKGVFRTRNIVVGNPQKADIIVTAHYDTCALSPLPNFMFPTNPIMFILFQAFLTIIIFATAYFAAVPFILYSNNPYIWFIVFDTVMFAFLIQLTCGFKNKHNANDNTSGVITLIKILEGLSVAEREKICVVFFDNEEKGLFGSMFFKKQHPEAQKKILLNIDCVGDGENILMMAKRKARKDEHYSKLVDTFKSVEGYNVNFISKKMKPLMFPSDQENFDKGIGMCSVKKGIFGMYAGRIHTPFDTKCREENVKYIANSILKFVKSI